MAAKRLDSAGSANSDAQAANRAIASCQCDSNNSKQDANSGAMSVTASASFATKANCQVAVKPPLPTRANYKKITLKACAELQ